MSPWMWKKMRPSICYLGHHEICSETEYLIDNILLFHIQKNRDLLNIPKTMSHPPSQEGKTQMRTHSELKTNAMRPNREIRTTDAAAWVLVVGVEQSVIHINRLSLLQNRIIWTFLEYAVDYFWCAWLQGHFVPTTAFTNYAYYNAFTDYYRSNCTDARMEAAVIGMNELRPHTNSSTQIVVSMEHD